MNEERLDTLQVESTTKTNAEEMSAETNVSSDSELDLVALLKQDNIEVCSWSSDSDESLSDWSDNEGSDDTIKDDAKSSTGSSHTVVPIKPEITQPNRWYKLPQLPPLKPPVAAPTYVKTVITPDRLFKLVHSNWWCPDIHINTVIADQSPLANFAVAYAQFLKSKNLNLKEYSNPKTTTEYCLLREIIFMFFKPVSCCYFVVQQEVITVRGQVTICSTTAPSLKGFLEDHIVPAMQALLQLRLIINQTTTCDNTPITMQCLAVALRDLIKPITKQLLAFERLLLDNAPEHHTLLSFTNHMRRSFKRLQVLNCIAAHLIVATEAAPPHMRSLYLLSELYQQMAPESPHQRLATSLLLFCLRPYCVILDTWWQRSALVDWRQEFIVESICSTGTYKHKIRLRQLEELKEKPEAVANLQKCDLYSMLREHALESAEIHQLLLELNLVDDMIKAFNQQDERTLHSQLIAEIYKRLKPLQKDASLQIYTETEPQPNPLKLKQTEQLMAELSIVRNRELLNIFTRPLLVTKTKSTKERPPTIMELLNYFENYNELNLVLQDFVLDALLRLLGRRRSFGHAYFMRLIREEWSFIAHVRCLRHVMLLEADYLLYPLYTLLFKKIESDEARAIMSWFNMELNEVVAASFGTLSTHFRLEMNSKVSTFGSNKVVKAIDCLQLSFAEKTPLKLIISAENMVDYSRILRMLLKLKWAIFTLSNMSLIKRAKLNAYAPLDLLHLTQRRLELLRLWFSFLFNNLHSHMYTSVFQDLWQQFERKFSKCSNMAELRVLHSENIGLHLKHCFLSANFAKFRLVLEQLLHLVYALQCAWKLCAKYFDAKCSEDDLHLFAIDLLPETEATYIRCHTALIRTLRHLTRKRDDSFLVALEMALTTSMPCL